ncbi:MAG: DoxX family protein, partial [Salinivirgaceae bacterium]|nr:DoxX family protein [Salinivirgaceae bacterium]
MNRLKPTLLLICRIVIGVTFIYSGFVKAVDPLGSTYKFIDYFNAFGMGWANGLAFGLSVLQDVIEFTLGVMMLFNLQIKLGSVLVLAFMVFYTPLTLYIAITNPVHDCGCFGDALVITNWQTFFKNLVLLAAAVMVFASRKQLVSKLKPIEQWALTGVAAAAILIFCGYSY